MSCSYSELYVDLTMEMLGDMYDYAVNTLGFSIHDFHELFINSGIAYQIEIGNPTYIAGKNGCEVAKIVLEKSGLSINQEDIMYVDKSPEYWTGWVLAYYQWASGYRFRDIENFAPIVDTLVLYNTYHEMDISAYVDLMNKKQREYQEESRLRRLRAYIGLSQSELAKVAGVPLRQIQLFEQGERDINKTSGNTLCSLARALKCDMDDLLQ